MFFFCNLKICLCCYLLCFRAKYPNPNCLCMVMYVQYNRQYHLVQISRLNHLNHLCAFLHITNTKMLWLIGLCLYFQVCTAFDTICQQLLNQGFSNAEKLHVVIYREIKAKLPRRESERRNHSLARHMDILAALETRLSLLAMTYIKYMEMGLCCFIPGKVCTRLLPCLLTVLL